MDITQPIGRFLAVVFGVVGAACLANRGEWVGAVYAISAAYWALEPVYRETKAQKDEADGPWIGIAQDT